VCLECVIRGGERGFGFLGVVGGGEGLREVKGVERGRG